MGAALLVDWRRARKPVTRSHSDVRQGREQGKGDAVQAGYRADIDGLRALAIVPVLLFHARVPGFGGGYIGVDIFFVISGYLITGLIAREIDAGRFSVLHFYERRARRIMPALMMMIAAVLVMASWLYFPDDLRKLPAAALAATLFYSNAHLFFDVNYFGGGAEIKPLLHTWSLAVEEQFYIGFPVLLMLIARVARDWRRAVVGAVTLLSFGIAVATQAKSDGFAFYLLPPRAWELFAGSLVALGVVPALGRRMREIFAVVGVGAIAFAIITYDKMTVFPGLTALPPVLGAAAIIMAGAETKVARLLAKPPLVGIGLISYSLYLWHWPVIVFAEYAGDAKLTGWSSVAAIALSLGFAVLSWRWVEQPFRDPQRFARRTIFVGTGAGMLTVCAAVVALASTNGWPSRFNPQALQYLAAARDISPMRATCHDADAARGRPVCTLGNTAHVDALLWGDSHGVEYAYAISERPGRAGRGLVQMTHSSCAPVIGFAMPQPGCDAQNAATIARIRADRRIRTVYLAAFWLSAAEIQPPAFWKALDHMIAALVGDGRHVVIIGPVGSNGFDVPRALAHGRQRGGIARSELIDRTQALRAIVNRWAGRGVTFVDPADSLCGPIACDIVRNGTPLYFDAHHPSLTAARLVAARIPTS
jgi:peptidoglycan/LPS O-acetylase OafA/YrhL